MANQVFDTAREGFLTGAIDWDTATIKVALVRGYTYDASHDTVSDVTGAGGTLHATSVALASKTATNGVADAADVTTWSPNPPTANATDHYVLVFQSSAVGGGADVAASAQRLIAYIDTATGLPIRPNGADITLSWDNGTNKIFRI